MIKHHHLIVTILTFGIFSSYGDDITTLKGKTYQNITVTRVEPDGITVRHTSGIEKLFFSELPQETRAKYGYDPEKHRRHYEAQQGAARQAAQSRSLDALAIHVEARLSQVQREGALAYIKTLTHYSYTERVKVDPTANRSKHILGSTPSVHSKDVVREGVRVSEEHPEPVFILGLSSGYVDGSTWRGVVYPIGSYNYVTVMGASKKIRQYTPSKAVAAKYYSE